MQIIPHPLTWLSVQKICASSCVNPLNPHKAMNTPIVHNGKLSQVQHIELEFSMTFAAVDKSQMERAIQASYNRVYYQYPWRQTYSLHKTLNAHLCAINDLYQHVEKKLFRKPFFWCSFRQ